jgi:hypothetical protein
MRRLREWWSANYSVEELLELGREIGSVWPLEVRWSPLVTGVAGHPDSRVAGRVDQNSSS